MMDELREYFDSYQSALGAGPNGDEIRHCIALGSGNRDDPMPLYRLALIAQNNGRWDLWHHAVLLASPLEHESPQSIYHRACHRTRLGDWSSFRAQTAVRHLLNEEARRLLWVAHEHDRTTDLTRKTLLIVRDGGFGDTLQVLCFVRPLAQRAARVILSVPADLLALVTYNFGDCAQVVTVEPDTPYERVYQFDEYLWGFSMADVIGSVPPFEPLHAPSPIPRATFNTRSLQIGLCWAASDRPEQPLSTRSITDVRLLEPLLSIGGIEWHSLQVGNSAAQAERYPQLQQPEPPLVTFEDTANLIVGLDAVVTVDTAVCHLAGRLGVPTFTLLPYVADERWGFGETTVWYPSMRLMREQQPNNWSSAIGPLANLLSALGTSGTAALARL